MPSRPFAELHLEADERRILRGIVQDGSTPRAVLGARVLLDLDSGHSVADVAQRCDSTPAAVRHQRDHFERFGVAMVGKVAPGRGRRPELRASVTAQVLDLVLHHPPPQGAYRWTTRTLAARCGVGKDTVACILREHHDEITASTEDESEAQRPSRPVARSRDRAVRSQTGAPHPAPVLATDRLMRSAVRRIDRDGRLNLGFFVKAGFVVPMMFKVTRAEDTLVLEAVEHDELVYDDKVRVATRMTTIARMRRATDSAGQVDDGASVTTTQATRARVAATRKAKGKPTIDKAVVDASTAKDEQIVYVLYLTSSRMRELRRKTNLDSVDSVAVAIQFNASRVLVRRVSFDRA